LKRGLAGGYGAFNAAGRQDYQRRQRGGAAKKPVRRFAVDHYRLFLMFFQFKRKRAK
jgi:hypothetical protein